MHFCQAGALVTDGNGTGEKSCVLAVAVKESNLKITPNL